MGCYGESGSRAPAFQRGCGLVRRSVRMILVAVAGFLGAGAAQGQLQGQISTTKNSYLAGEPIYIHFEVTNAGNVPVEYSAGDPYEWCGGYALEVSNGPALAHPSCAPAKQPECNASDAILAAGETVRQNILVNYAHEVAKPGNYEIHAVRVMRYRPLTGVGTLAADGKDFKIEKSLQIQVVKADADALGAIYRVYVRNLGSQDDEMQREAERAIVSGAMPWLEDTIVGMVRQYRSREFALLGLKNLNTVRAREELAKIVQNSSELTPENEMAVGYLGQMGDKKYLPILLELATKVEASQGREYVLAAAELGGDDAVPYLKELVGSGDANARANGVAGLGVTGSRAAVPLLIEALKSGNADLAQGAENALMGLTHRRVSGGDASAERAEKWAAWWAAQGSSAKVYGPRECGEVEGE
jgi:hypothetical protein